MTRCRSLFRSRNYFLNGNITQNCYDFRRVKIVINAAFVVGARNGGNNIFVNTDEKSCFIGDLKVTAVEDNTVRAVKGIFGDTAG